MWCKSTNDMLSGSKVSCIRRIKEDNIIICVNSDEAI